MAAKLGTVEIELRIGNAEAVLAFVGACARVAAAQEAKELIDPAAIAGRLEEACRGMVALVSPNCPLTVAQIERIHVEPGDALVVSCDVALAESSISRIRETILRELGCRSVVLDPGLQLAAAVTPAR